MKSTTTQNNKAIATAETKSAEAANDLWTAIRTVISLQNQAPSLVPVDRKSDQPLSFNQERLWLLEQLSSGSTAYNIPFALRLTGELDITALEQSFKEILRRHEALRTRFTTVDCNPVQLVTETEDDWSLTVKQLPSSLISDERETAIARLVQEVAQQPFDLTSGYLLKACLVQLEPTEHLLLVTVHHIAFDGWSEGIFWRELAALYESFTQGKSSSLPELAIQYADFAVWQRQWLQNDFLAALNSYWQSKLGTNIQELALPIDYPAPDLPTRKSSTYKLTLSPSLTDELKQLSYKSRATLFATLLTSFKILLRVYTEQDDLFVCSPIASRNRPELKQIIGYLVNLLILRSDLSGNPSFDKLLSRVSKTVTGAYAHQDFPLQQLVQDLGLGQKSLSQVMFVLQNNDRTTPTLSGLTVEELEVDNGEADFDLSLSLTENQNRLVGLWKYNTDLFSAESIATIAEHWQTLLEKIVADPTQAIDSLLVLNKRDRQQLRAKQANRLSVRDQVKSRATNSKPRNALEFRLIKLWSEILEIPEIQLQDNFFEIGGSSLLAFRLIAEIENSFGKKLPLSALLQAPTIEKLAKLINQEGQTSSSSWLNPPQSRNSRPILFCIPPAGNSLLGFANIVHHLGADYPFYVPQPLGLEGETTPQDRVEDMAAHYIQEIQAIQPAGSYYLGGRCFGGIVAFEMARQLVEQGEKIALLALIDGGLPPNIYSKLRNADGSKKEKSLAQYWQSFAYFCRNGQLLTILQYRYRQQLRKIKAKYFPNKAAPDPLMTNVQRVFRSHMKARASYMPSSSYPGKITIFASNTLRLDQQDGWNKLATEGIECHLVGGSHGTIDQEPYVRILAAKLRTVLQKTEAFMQ